MAVKINADEHGNNSLKKEKVNTVEDALEKIGGYSWFQIFATISIIFPELTSSMISMSGVLFGSSRSIQYQCITDESHQVLNIEEVCHYNCTGVLRPMALLGTYSSVVEEWDLICNRAWIVDMLSSVQMTGGMLGAITCSSLADRFGRRTIFYLLCFFMGISSFSSGWATDVITFGVTRLLAGFAVGGTYVVFVNYLMEFLTPSYRKISSCLSFWAFGEMLLALIGYYFQNWKELILISSLPVLLVLLTIPWIPESPRWLLCQGRTDAALHAFNKIASFNRKPLITSEEIERVQENINKSSNNNNGELSPQKITVIQILRDSEYRSKLLLFILTWFTISLSYLTLSLNMKNLSGDKYLNVFFLGICDLPGCFSGLFFINKYGRKTSFIVFQSFATGFLLILAILTQIKLESIDDNVITILALIGRCFSSASWAILTCFTAECFPTVKRATCLGICSFFANIGGIIAGQIVFLSTMWKPGPYIVLSVFNLVTLFKCISMRETTGKPLQDSPHRIESKPGELTKV